MLRAVINTIFRILKSDNLTYLLVGLVLLLMKLVILKQVNLKWLVIMGISHTTLTNIQTLIKTKILWLEVNLIKSMKTSLWLDLFQSLILILKVLIRWVQTVKAIISRFTMLLLPHLELKLIYLLLILMILLFKRIIVLTTK